ncbi:hypothetical protein GCM10010472_22990 [Pseudonocardia halophobica]|uniref:Uncharacterized protein n=1 Tax=Pseudonocardia halophobica TaxID=29401 RepID=A0A9W6KYD2_9PSEU|nr:hypothetical protein GCM10017577_06720 [Pseudonocardia halophobica]
MRLNGATSVPLSRRDIMLMGDPLLVGPVESVLSGGTPSTLRRRCARAQGRPSRAGTPDGPDREGRARGPVERGRRSRLREVPAGSAGPERAGVHRLVGGR